MQNTRHSCRVVMKFEFSGHIFEKPLNVKFHENPSSGSQVVPFGLMGDGQIDRQT